jgi:hypothetical protein
MLKRQIPRFHSYVESRPKNNNNIIVNKRETGKNKQREIRRDFNMNDRARGENMVEIHCILA